MIYLYSMILFVWYREMKGSEYRLQTNTTEKPLNTNVLIIFSEYLRLNCNTNGISTPQTN